jgi:hypothetical protein
MVPSKFIFSKIIPKENFGQLLGFFPKGLMPLKIQNKFKYCLLPEFVIQNTFGICAQKESYYLFCQPKTLVIF